MGCFVAFAQKKKEARPVKKEVKEKEDSLNKTDGDNRKQGTWFYKHEARMGEPEYSEFGNYKDDMKTGLWYKVDKEGVILATENYLRNALNGTAQYYDKGRLICIGTYRGLNPDNKYDSIWIKDIDTYEDRVVVVSSEKGTMKHGIWRYYDAVSGHMIREEEYQVDDLVFKKDFEVRAKMDSTQLKKIDANMPHNKKKKTKATKTFSY